MRLVIHLIFILSSLSAQAQKVGFEQVLNKILSNNTEISIQESLQKSNESLLSASQMAWTPSLSATLTQTKFKESGADAIDSDSATVGLSLNLFKGGDTYYGMQSARVLAESGRYELKAKKLSVRLAASYLIFNRNKLYQEIAIAEQVVKQKEESLRVAKLRFGRGQLSNQDLQRVEIDLAAGRTSLRELKVYELEVANEVQVLYGEDIPFIEWPWLNFSEANIKKDKLKSKTPEILSLSKKSDYFKYKLKESRSGFMPRLDLNLNYAVSPIRDQDINQFTTSLVLTIPIWDRWETAAQNQIAAENLVQSELSYKKRAQEVELQKNSVEQKITLTKESLQEALTSLEKSRKLYADTLRSFQMGRTSVNDLFLEQQRLFNYEISYQTQVLNFHKSIAEYRSLTSDLESN